MLEFKSGIGGSFDFRVYDTMIDDHSNAYESSQHKNNSSHKLEQMFSATWRFQLQ